MKLILKRISVISLACLLLFFAFSVKKYRLGGLKLSKVLRVSDNLSNNKKDAAINQIFANSFRYLGRGTQFYAFESLDQKYVVKILRSDRLNIRLSKKIFPKLAKKIKMRNNQRKQRFLNACIIADNLLKKQTGVVLAHLNKTYHLQPIEIIDNFGFSKKINLDNLCFLIQKKVTLIKDAFRKAKKENNVLQAKEKINAFLKIIVQRSNLGISNSDPDVFMNFGFSDKQAIELDFGDYYQNPALLSNQASFNSEINKYALVLRDWLNSFWPELISYFDLQLNQVLMCEKIYN